MNGELFPIYVLNLVVVLAMLIVTIYRAWIEWKQMKTIREVETLKKIFEMEQDQIKNMTGEEFIDMLRTILR